MKPPKIIIPINLVDVQGCVYKLYYGERFIVVMAKSMYRSIEIINLDIARFFNGADLEKNKNNLYYKFYIGMLDLNPPFFKFRIDVIFESDKPYQLLKACQEELDKSMGDPMCDNTHFEPYINKDIQRPAKDRKANWWINRGTYLNFRTWQKKRTTQ